MEERRYVITAEQVLENIDEDTIGVVAILGTTFTGQLEPIGEICEALDKLAEAAGSTYPCTSTRPAVGSSSHSFDADLIWDFGCRAWCRSTSAATSTG